MTDSQIHTPNEPEDKPRTPGENLFDALAYIGLGGIVNAAISIKFADWVHTDWTRAPAAQQEQMASKKTYNFIYKGAEYLAKPLEGVFGKSGQKTVNGATEFTGAIKYTRRFMQGGVLGIGGWLMLPFIKAMEDRKPEIVNSLNSSLGVKTAEVIDSRDDLGDESKQSWVSLIGGRAVAFFGALAVAAPLLEYASRRNGRDIFESIADFSRDKMGLKPEKLVKGMSVARGKEWSYQLAGEAFYTAFGVALLYGASKVISGWQEPATPVPQPAAPQPEAEKKRVADRPDTRIPARQAQHHARLEPVPEQQVGH